MYTDIFVSAFFFGLKNIRVHMWRIPIAFESFSLSTGIRMHSWLLIMLKVVCWQHFLCFVNEFHERVFQGPRSIRHVNLKTGSDSVTLVNSKIC